MNPVKPDPSSAPSDVRKPASGWFIFIGSEKKGPFPKGMLRQLVEQGLVKPDTYVQREQDGAPRPLREFDPHTLKLLPQFAPLPRAAEPAPPPPPEWRSWRYFPLHWRGALPLPLAALNALLPLPFSAALLAWWTRIEDLGAHGQGMAGLLVLLLLALIAVSAWQFVGLWRCLRKSAVAQAKRHAAVGTMAVAVLLAAWTMAPPLWDWLRIAAGIDPQGSYRLAIHPEIGVLRIDGAPGYGLTARVQATLDQSPHTRIVQLELQGGRVAEAQRLRDLIHRRKLITFTELRCGGPCTAAFVAGAQRLLGPQAQLAFHRYPDARNPRRSLQKRQLEDKAFFEAQGVLLPLPLKMFQADPEQAWLPPPQLLLETRTVQQIVPASQLQLALNAPVQFDLLSHPVMRALKTAAPERYHALTDTLQQQLQARVPEQEAAAAFLLALDRLLREQARHAANAPLQDYVRGLIGLAHHVQERDPALCYTVLFGLGSESELAKQVSSFDLFQHRLRAAALLQSSFAAPVQTVASAGRGVPVFRQALARKGDSDVLLAGTPQAASLPPERRCQAALNFLENALRLPEEYRYDVLRSLL